MSKKRSRDDSSSPSEVTSKLQAGYWQQRLFKNSYSYKGRRIEVNHWAVKIQHDHQRKTFSLKAAEPHRAAREACELYRAILKAGSLDSFAASWPKRSSEVRANFDAKAAVAKSTPQYWDQRLIHREYAMKPNRGEYSFAVRIDHEGLSSYFPLGTPDRANAAAKAARIFQVIQRQGWEKATERFSREVTAGFRWSDSPLAWTYTTLHTLLKPAKAHRSSARSGIIGVAIADADAGIREAMAWCINRMDHFRVARQFASAAEALAGLDSRLIQLILVSQNLPDKPGKVCLGELRAAAPSTACLLYSTYEDSEELFRSTPGGAGTYVLKRTSASEFLEPIASALSEPNPTLQSMLDGVWQYFKHSLSSPPASDAAHELANLTRREEEVLALLGKGQPDKEIAEHLRISAHTVHGHVRKIFEKLGVHNRTEAVVRYLQK